MSVGIKDGLNTYLRTKTAVTNIVGQQIYPNKVPQTVNLNTAPAIAYTLISRPRDLMLTSASGLVTARFQLDCYAVTYLAADALGEALRGALDGFRGTMGTMTVQCCRCEEESDNFTPPEDQDDIGVYGVRFDVMVSYTESIPALP